MSSYQQRINDRRLILGSNDKLMAISPMKHAWARGVWKEMLGRTWFPEEVGMGDDKLCYNTRLTDQERRMYDKALAFLSNLDGIQFNNITNNIAVHVTSPEVSMALSRQAFEEALHVDSYAVMIETVSLDPMKVYMTFEQDGILAMKNQYVLNQSAILTSDFTPYNFSLALVSNVMLEGIYFFSGFLAFYVLARNGKMLGSADMIRYIQRDEEQSHLTLFKRMIETMRIENPEVFTAKFYEDAKKLMIEATEMEINWGIYISEGVFGMTPQIIEGYLRWLCNKRAAEIGMPFVPYPDAKVNPIPWVEEFSCVNGSEKNFFETKPTDYTVGALDWND